MKNFLLIGVLFFAIGCSHSVHLVNMSDQTTKMDRSRGKKIQVESKQHVIFWFVFNTDYVDRAKDMLIKKCPNGDIKNIMTRYSTSHGFFNWYNKIHMQGYCFTKS